MNKLIIQPLFFCLVLLFLSNNKIFAQSPEGKTYRTSECASGGIDYHFFKNGIVIGVCKGCESLPLIQSGSWEIKNDMIFFNMSRVPSLPP